MSRKNSKKLKTVLPITNYFRRTDLDNVMPLKSKRRTVKNGRPEEKLHYMSCDELLLSEFSSSRKQIKQSDTPWSSPLIIDRESLSPPCLFLPSHSPDNFKQTVNKQSSQNSKTNDIYSISTDYGSDLEIIEEWCLKESNIPTWLRSPHVSSSDSSDDDLMKPVTFHSHKVIVDSECLEMAAKYIKIHKECNQDIDKIPCTDMSLTSYPEKFHKPSPVKEMTNVKCTLALDISEESMTMDVSDTYTSLEDKRLALLSCDLEYDTVPPYMKELECLVIINGVMPLLYSEDKVTLFNQNQRDTLEVLLALRFLPLSMQLGDSIDYLLMVNSSYCMVPADSLIQFWTTFTDTKKTLSDREVTCKIVHYFHCLVTSHPPGQHELVREQYLFFLQSIHSSLIPLIMSKEKWKVELLSVIVGLLLADYRQCHQLNRCYPPLFHCIFWTHTERHFINTTIRHLIQIALDVYKDKGSFIQTLQAEILTQLFFLIFTECEDIASDLTIEFSSLPSLPLFTALSSLAPLKLKDYVSDKVTLKDSIKAHESVKLYLMVNSILLKH